MMKNISLFLCVVLLCASCATSPKNLGPLSNDPGDFAYLPGGADLYIRAGADALKSIVEALPELGLSGKDADRILERTDTAVAALYPAGGERNFFAVGRGNYPKAGAGVSMAFSRAWKKVKTPTGYRCWYAKAGNLWAALDSRQALVSDADPFAVFGKGVSGSVPPEGFTDFSRDSSLSGCVSDAETKLNSIQLSMALPIQIPAEQLFFGLFDMAPPAALETAAPYREMLCRIQTPSASQARALVTLISMARLFMAGDGPLFLFFTNVPLQDGVFLTLRSGALSEEQTALLFKQFSVYLK
jgi:hypothetical protein